MISRLVFGFAIADIIVGLLIILLSVNKTLIFRPPILRKFCLCIGVFVLIIGVATVVGYFISLWKVCEVIPYDVKEWRY